ncbi:MAG TPA: VOC family protein [Terriglobia bacterium]|nr:VOC family protein [Terriglobia bacterium]
MINAAHVVIYSKDAEADRAFFRDVLRFPSVDAGQGWLIFALPSAELGIHPTNEETAPGKGVLQGRHQLYLTCDDVNATVRELEAKGVSFTEPVKDVGWGVLTALQLPGGSGLYLYQPRHASPLK